MQKQLITDILIEEYQKKIKPLKFLVRTDERHVTIISYENFITRLQSLRQQEQQNVIDAVDETLISVGYANSQTQKGNDYFTQTFEQKGGGQK